MSNCPRCQIVLGVKLSHHPFTFPLGTKHFHTPNIFLLLWRPNIFKLQAFSSFSFSKYVPSFLPIFRLQSPKRCKSTSFHWGLPLPPTPKKGRKIPNCKSPPEVTPRLYLNEDLISKLNKRLSVYNLESDCELEAASFLTVWQRDNGLDWLGGRAGEWSWVEKTRKCFFVSDPLRVGDLCDT